MMTKNEYKKAEARYNALFDKVITLTGRYSDAAIAAALDPAEAAEFRGLRDALSDYDSQRAFSAVLASGNYRS